MEKSTLGLGVFSKLLGFGVHIGDTDIAIVTCRLYRDALAASTRSTYKTGVRHLRKFTQKYPKIPLPTVDINSHSRLTLSLVFFAAYLFELDSIKSYSTIRNYMTHVTQFYVKKGYAKKSLKSELLQTVMRGIKNSMPPKADSRVAFLLIHYHIPTRLRRTRSTLIKKATVAISFGFFAMLRFHSYGKFGWKNLTLVLRGGKEVVLSTLTRITVSRLLASNCVTGFYFTFADKFHPEARAYFCKVADLHRRLSLICPLKNLQKIVEVCQDELFFPPSEITRTVLTQNMKSISRIEKNIKPHSLRIGGHTYYTVYGLDTDFRDYLARRKIKKSSQTYYRASPHLTIYKLRQFFKRSFT